MAVMPERARNPDVWIFDRSPSDSENNENWVLFFFNYVHSHCFCLFFSYLFIWLHRVLVHHAGFLLGAHRLSS